MNPAHTGRDCKFLSSADWLSADRKRTQSQSSSYSISERQKYHRCLLLSLASLAERLETEKPQATLSSLGKVSETY